MAKTQRESKPYEARDLLIALETALNNLKNQINENDFDGIKLQQYKSIVLATKFKKALFSFVRSGAEATFDYQGLYADYMGYIESVVSSNLKIITSNKSYP